MDAIARFFAAHADLTLLAGLFAPDCQSKANGKVVEGPDAAAAVVATFSSTYGKGRFQELGRLDRPNGIAVTWNFHPERGGDTIQGATHFVLKDDAIQQLATRWLDL